MLNLPFSWKNHFVSYTRFIVALLREKTCMDAFELDLHFGAGIQINYFMHHNAVEFSIRYTFWYAVELSVHDTIFHILFFCVNKDDKIAESCFWFSSTFCRIINGVIFPWKEIFTYCKFVWLQKCYCKLETLIHNQCLMNDALGLRFKSYLIVIFVIIDLSHSSIEPIVTQFRLKDGSLSEKLGSDWIIFSVEHILGSFSFIEVFDTTAS